MNIQLNHYGALRELKEPITKKLSDEDLETAKGLDNEPYQKVRPDETFYAAIYSGRIFDDLYVSQYGTVLRDHRNAETVSARGRGIKQLKPYVCGKEEVYFQIEYYKTTKGEVDSLRLRVNRLVAEVWLPKPTFQGFAFPYVEKSDENENVGKIDDLIIEDRKEADITGISDEIIEAMKMYKKIDSHHLIQLDRDNEDEEILIPEDYDWAVNLQWVYNKLHAKIGKFAYYVVPLSKDEEGDKDPSSINKYIKVATPIDLAKYYNVSECDIFILLEGVPAFKTREYWKYEALLITKQLERIPAVFYAIGNKKMHMQVMKSKKVNL